MFLKHLFSILFLSGMSSLSAQDGRTTSSMAYTVMLKALLSNTVEAINVKQAFKLHTQQAVFLDARPDSEFRVSHIQNAIRVGYDDFSVFSVEALPKSTPIIIYCSVGYRSEKIGERLKALGYTKVYNLYGGIFEWVNAGYPVYNAAGVTQKVHAFNSKWGIWLKKGQKVY